MKYDVDYFIAKFEAIPENLWCERARVKGDQRCALGWCYPSAEAAKKSEVFMHEDSIEDRCLTNLIHTINEDFGVGGINNGIYWQYSQPTPKQRILAALYDIREKELSEANIKAVEEIVNQENILV